MQNFPALGAPPPDPRASGGWGLCPPQPPAAGGFAPRPPLASGGWGLRPQTPQTAPPIANFWLRAWWVVCLLHTNELPLRHIFQYLDGGTKSPNAFAGPIGKSLDSNSSQWPVITFKPILNPYFPTLPNEVLEELSTDQYYGYRICWAVICGEVDEDLKLGQQFIPGG